MLPSKQEMFERALDVPHSADAIVALTIDPRDPGVELPPDVEAGPDGSVCLNYSKWFSDVPIVTPRGIRCVQSFGGADYSTYVPWTAVRTMFEIQTRVAIIWTRTEMVDDSKPKRTGLRVVPDEEN